MDGSSGAGPILFAKPGDGARVGGAGLRRNRENLNRLRRGNPEACFGRIGFVGTLGASDDPDLLRSVRTNPLQHRSGAAMAPRRDPGQPP